MSRQSPASYQHLAPWGSPGNSSRAAVATAPVDPQLIIPTAHDILSGRGVNIAQHVGNERFRALVNSRYDANYCSTYTTTEKRAVAREIIAHIRSLNPPGRFLKRTGRGGANRGLEGPWEELSDVQAIKKTCQALRDCNRQDRTGYAAAVPVPEDVRHQQELRSQTGLTNKEYAQQAAVARLSLALQQQLREQEQKLLFQQQEQHGQQEHEEQDTHAEFSLGKRVRLEPLPLSGAISPSIEQGAVWLKRQRMDTDATTPHTCSTTPTTVATSGGTLDRSSLLYSDHSTAGTVAHHHHHDVGHIHDPAAAHHSAFLAADDGRSNSMPPSPQASSFHESLSATFHEAFIPLAVTSVPTDQDHHQDHHLDPLQHLASSTIESGSENPFGDPSLQEMSAASLGHADDDDVDVEGDFPPPSPYHPYQHPGDRVLDSYDD